MEKIKELENLIGGFDEKWMRIVSGTLIIDSNVWMNKSYENLFLVFSQYLQTREKNITMLSEQFDEIVNIKDKNSKSEKGGLARLALSRIELMVDKNIMNIGDIKLSSNPKAYADPVILRYIMREAKKNPVIMLVTDDKELRIRMKLFIQSGGLTGVGIIDGATLNQDFANYAEWCDELEYLDKENFFVKLRYSSLSEVKKLSKDDGWDSAPQRNMSHLGLFEYIINNDKDGYNRRKFLEQKYDSKYKSKESDQINWVQAKPGGWFDWLK